MSLPVAPAFDRVRLIPRPNDFLNRNVGASGELFYEKESRTLRVFSGLQRGGFEVVTEENLRKNVANAEVATVKYLVTVNNSGNGNKYVLTGEEAPALNLEIGYTYLIDQSDQTNLYYPNAQGGKINQHPLNFSADDPNGSLASGTSYTSGVMYKLEGLEVTQAQYWANFARSVSRQVQITVTSTTPSTLYYWCQQHLNMGNTIATGSPGAGSGASLEVSDSAPANPSAGSIWFNSTSGYLYVYVEDVDSSQWVQPVAGNVFSGSFNDLVDTPTTLAGYGITDAPLLLTDLGIVDGTVGQVLTTNGSGTFTFADAAGGSLYDQSLNTTDDVIFNSVTSPTLLSNGTGITSIASASALTIATADGIRVSGGPFRLPSVTTVEKTALTAANGDMVYDTDLNKAQVYENGAWASLV